MRIRPTPPLTSQSAAGTATPDTAVAEPAVALATEESPDPLEIATPRPCRVLVTGATGFVGRHLLPRLMTRQHRIRALYYRDPGDVRGRIPWVEWHRVDLTDRGSVAGVAAECDCVVHLAGITRATAGRSCTQVNRDGTRHLLEEAERAGVERFIHVSALGADPGEGDFFRSKRMAEEAVRRSGLPYVIFRPAVIYGPDDHLTTSVARVLRVFPVFPVLGDGSFRLQPVAIEDVTDALWQAVEREELDRRVFDLTGPDVLSFRAMVRMVAGTLGLRRPILRVPHRLVRVVVRMASRWDFPSSLLPDQLEILRGAGEVGAGRAHGSSRQNPLVSVFHLKPLPFGDALADYL